MEEINIKVDEIISQNTIKNKKVKMLHEGSFPIELNCIETPLFHFQPQRVVTTVGELKREKNISNDIKKVLKLTPKSNESSIVEFSSWIDSKGVSRELLTMSTLELPGAFCMDVLYGLIGLFIKKNSPILFNEETKVYDIENGLFEFSLYELCEFMKLKVGGGNYMIIKEAILKLDAVKYYSLGEGSLYKKSANEYHTSSLKSIGLISDVTLTERSNKAEKSTLCSLKFADLLLSNIKYSFIKFLSKDVFFELPSGIVRRLYSYLESNRFEGNKERIYIKRSLDVLSRKLPLKYKYKSKLKERLSRACKKLIEHGIISDAFFGDDLLVNNIKEDCIYFIFKGSRKTVLNILKDDNNNREPDTKGNEDSNDKMKFPEDIKLELENLNIEQNKIVELMSKHSKYALAEYILWIKEGIKKRNVNDPAGLFIFATSGMVNVSKSCPHISKFVAKHKEEVDGKKAFVEEDIQVAYKEYVEKEIDKFKVEEEFAYVAAIQTTLDDLEKVYKKKIKAQQNLYNMTKTDIEKEKILAMICKWQAFEFEKENSEIFIELFIKGIKLYRGIKDYNEFKQNYIMENR